jgi:CubicO group peptidase (beta-lactamase class C family)
MQHLLTHVSGLPDQLAENQELRSKHASLSEFVEHAIRTPLHFVPGSRYQYSSMAILLAARVAELISGTDILTLVDRAVFQPLKMRRSAQGVGIGTASGGATSARPGEARMSRRRTSQYSWRSSSMRRGRA